MEDTVVQTIEKVKTLRDFLNRIYEMKAIRIALILSNSYTHTLHIFHNETKELIGYYITPKKWFDPTFVHPGVSLLDITRDHEGVEKIIAKLILEGRIKLPCK